MFSRCEKGVFEVIFRNYKNGYDEGILNHVVDRSYGGRTRDFQFDSLTLVT